MATRRKYKSSDYAETNVAVVAPEDSAPADDNPMQRALEAQRHAEDLQRQNAHRQEIGLPEPHLNPEQRQAIDADIDRMDGLSDHKRRFLKAHPSLILSPYRESMAHAHFVALRAGVPDDTADMDRAILIGVIRDIEHHRGLAEMTAATAQPTPENAQHHHDVGLAADALHQEAQAHLAAMAEPAPPPPTPKRSIPMSAPVSRDVPGSSGYRRSAEAKGTLTPEERQIAHNFTTDKSLSNAEKEYLYWKNKQKLASKRADGSYSEQQG